MDRSNVVCDLTARYLCPANLAPAMEGLQGPDVDRGRVMRVDDGDSHEDDDRHDETEEIQLNWLGREEEEQDRDDPDNDTGKCDLAEVLSEIPIPLPSAATYSGWFAFMWVWKPLKLRAWPQNGHVDCPTL